MSGRDEVCTIAFADEEQKAKAFYALIHSGTQFPGIGKDTLIVTRKDRLMLKSKRMRCRAVRG